MVLTGDSRLRTNRRSRSKKFKFCISVSASTVDKLEEKIRLARGYRPDFIELRLDYLHGISNHEIETTSRLLRGNEILTLRSTNEGGRFKDGEKSRVQLIKERILPISKKFDIEIATLRAHPEILKIAERVGSSIITSLHDLKGRKSAREIRKIISKVPERNSIFAVKVVREANNFNDNFRVLDLYNSFKAKRKLIAFCTGPLGVLSRVLCLFLGSPYTYASLPEEPLASGQLDIDTMRDAVRLARKGIVWP